MDEEETDVDSSSTIKVGSELDCIPANEVVIESIECVKCDKREDITSYNTEIGIETEIHDKPASTKCFVFLDRLDLDYEKYVIDKEAIKYEQNVQNEYTSDGSAVKVEELKILPHYDNETEIDYDETEIHGMKEEADIEEHELRYEQLESVKTEHCETDPSNQYTEYATAKCYVLLERLEFNHGQSDDTSNDVKLDVENQTVVHQCQPGCEYETQDVTRSYQHKNNSERLQSVCPVCKVEKLECNHGQWVNDVETTKHGQNIESKDTSNDIEVDMENQTAVQQCQPDSCDYETGNITRSDKHKNNIEQLQSLHSNYKGQDETTLHTNIVVIYKGNVKYFKCQFCEYITKHVNNIEMHCTRKHHEETTELYQCFDCNYKARVKEYLVGHWRKEHRTKEWQRCQLCNFKTKYKENLLRHHRIQHDDSPETFHCQLCDYKAKVKHYLSRHHRIKHDGTAETFHCHQCDFKTKYKDCLITHVKSKHDSSFKMFHCVLCDFKTKHRGSLSQHHKFIHDAAYIFHCKLCDFKTKYQHNFLQHHKLKHDDAAEFFHCALCDYKTKNKHYLLRHHRSKHDDAAEIFHCKLCDYKTKCAYHLKIHRLKHDDAANIFNCELCNYKTKYSHNMLEHRRLKHDAAAEVFHCEVCDYKTKSKSSFTYHRLKHDDTAQIFHCVMCDYKTKNKHYLSKHHKSQHDDSAEVFQCKLCDYKTKDKYCLWQHHKLKHDEAADILHCDRCDFKTKIRKFLLKHKRIKHTTEFLHCELCDFKTKYSENLRKHHRFKHNDAAEIFQCKLCDFTTKYKRSLSEHNRIKHDSS